MVLYSKLHRVCLYMSLCFTPLPHSTPAVNSKHRHSWSCFLSKTACSCYECIPGFRVSVDHPGRKIIHPESLRGLFNGSIHSDRFRLVVGKLYAALTTSYLPICFPLLTIMLPATSTMGLKYDPKYWANRAGHIASVQLPLMTALGTKNNILSCASSSYFELWGSAYDIYDSYS